jgi:hypothetical protein
MLPFHPHSYLETILDEWKGLLDQHDLHHHLEKPSNLETRAR